MRLFNFLTRFPFTTSETELACYRHKVNLRVSKLNVKRRKRSLEMKKDWVLLKPRTTDHRPTDPPTTYRLPTDPPTTYPPTHRPAIIDLS